MASTACTAPCSSCQMACTQPETKVGKQQRQASPTSAIIPVHHGMMAVTRAPQLTLYTIRCLLTLLSPSKTSDTTSMLTCRPSPETVEHFHQICK